MTREILTALAAGLASAVLYLSMRTGSPGAILLAYLAPLPLVFVGLFAGWIWTGVAGITALAGIAAGASPMLAGMFALMTVLPSLIVTRQGLLARPGQAESSLEWYPPGMLVGWLTGYALAGVTGVALALAGQEGGIVGVTERYLAAVLRSVAPGQASTGVATAVQSAARYMPGMMGAVWLALMAVNGALAQGLLVRLGWNRRPSPAYAALELPRWLGVPLAISAAATLMPGQIGGAGLAALIVSATPFMFLGLAVMHTLLRGRPGRGFIMSAAYIAILLFSWPAILFVGLGIIEQWVQLRRRFQGPPDDQEEV